MADLNPQSRTATGTFPAHPTPSRDTSQWSHATVLNSLLRPDSTVIHNDIGDYQVEELLARGGMGVVYRARHRQTGDRVALKTLRLDVFATPDLVERFRREVRAASLDHPYVMPILDTGESSGRPFFVMPLAKDNLAKRMDDYREPKSAADLMAKVARGVAAAHRAGIIHRDLKPGNVLIDEYGEPRVADFGLAKLIDELDTLSLTRTGAILGTPGYMAPEQAAGSNEAIGPGVDIWAAGVILYELVTGRRPFDGPSRESTLERIRTIDPPSPRTWRPDLDRNLERLILACLAKRPGDRYANADALADDLQAWLAGRKVVGVPRPRLALFDPRRWKLSKMTAALVVLLSLFGLAWASVAPLKTDQQLDWDNSVATEAKRQWVENEIRAGRAVDFVPGNRPPRWHTWEAVHLGSQRMMHRGVTIVQANDVSLLELSRVAPAEYRLEGEFQFNNASNPGNPGAGFYAGFRWVHEDNRGFVGFFCVRFSELNEAARKVPATASLYLIVLEPNSPHVYEAKFDAVALPPVPAEQPVWRSIGLDLTNDGVALRFAGKTRELQTTKFVRGEYRHMSTQMQFPAALADAPFGGPIGIYVDRCTASVRNVRLTPLKPRE